MLPLNAVNFSAPFMVEMICKIQGSVARSMNSPPPLSITSPPFLFRRAAFAFHPATTNDSAPLFPSYIFYRRATSWAAKPFRYWVFVDVSSIAIVSLLAREGVIYHFASQLDGDFTIHFGVKHTIASVDYQLAPISTTQINSLV